MTQSAMASRVLITEVCDSIVTCCYSQLLRLLRFLTIEYSLQALRLNCVQQHVSSFLSTGSRITCFLNRLWAQHASAAQRPSPSTYCQKKKKTVLVHPSRYDGRLQARYAQR
jgi:hypothetical protein